MITTQLTVKLPESEINFLEEFAKRHQTTISALIRHYVEQLHIVENYSHHPDIEKFGGIIPTGLDARETYYEHIEEKHR